MSPDVPLASERESEVLVVPDGRDILLVDDDPANLGALEAALAPLGRRLTLVRSGTEALDKLRVHDFAVIILGVAMPGMDGLETARLVRSSTRNHTTPIIFVTDVGWDHAADLRGYELGAFAFLMKPIRPEVVRGKVSVLVQLQERTLELKAKADELREAQARAHERALLAQRRRFETEALEQEMRQLTETNRRKDEFLAILAHELRNPLQPLQTAVEVLEHHPDQPVPARIRAIVQRQVHHITRLVDDLLDVARFNAGKLELRREPVALTLIIDEAITQCQTAITQRSHTIEIVGEALPVIVDGDPVRLTQVVCNLLTNAAKYTEPGGHLTIAWGHEDGHGFIRVTDTGRGIRPDILPRVFDMFVQERVTSDGAGGLGLGLGLVKRLVELHGGTVRVTSAGLGLGSTFEIMVGLDARAFDPIVLARTKTGPRKASLRAVVCDDAPDLRDLLADLLRLRGHQVTIVEDGPSAVAAICAERPDVALIDIGLPGMDGYEVARQLRRAITTDPPRLIAMTGYGQAGDRALAFAAGFDEHIVKPASADDILRALYGPSPPR
ncbi:MAG: response regulator [Myxococcales bacterium]|nr:response regulator [Myxococcales bacterium]